MPASLPPPLLAHSSAGLEYLAWGFVLFYLAQGILLASLPALLLLQAEPPHPEGLPPAPPSPLRRARLLAASVATLFGLGYSVGIILFLNEREPNTIPAEGYLLSAAAFLAAEALAFLLRHRYLRTSTRCWHHSR